MTLSCSDLVSSLVLNSSFPRPSGDRPPRGRGGGRGGRGGRGRGMGRGDGFDSRGKRDFDRHSGNDKP